METEEMYDEFLDSTYGEVQIAGMTYLTSVALKAVDHIAWREGYFDFEDSLEDEG